MQRDGVDNLFNMSGHVLDEEWLGSEYHEVEFPDQFNQCSSPPFSLVCPPECANTVNEQSTHFRVILEECSEWIQCKDELIHRVTVHHMEPTQTRSNQLFAVHLSGWLDSMRLYNTLHDSGKPPEIELIICWDKESIDISSRESYAMPEFWQDADCSNV